MERKGFVIVAEQDALEASATGGKATADGERG
jgi:hypothetical protein